MSNQFAAIKNLSLKDFFLSGEFAGALILFNPILMMWISRGRNPDEYDAIDTSAMIQMLYAGIVFLVGIYYIYNSVLAQKILFSTPLRYLLIYSVLGVISMIWSINWKVSLYRGFECIAYQLVIVSLFDRLIRRLSILHTVQWILYYAVFIMLISVYRRMQWSGLTIGLIFSEQFNSTPFFFIALFFPAFWGIKYFILGSSILSQSNTAYAGMAAGLLAFREGKNWMKALLVLILLLSLLAIFVLGVDNILQNTIFYGKEGVGMQYTSGRDKIIEKSIPYILDRPLIGYGFVAPEIQLVTKRQVGIIGVHNAVLSSLLGTGILGLTLLFLFFYGMFQMAKAKFFPPKWKAAFVGTVFIGFFHSIANPGIGSRLFGTWMPIVLLFTLIATIYIVQMYNLKYYETCLFKPKVSDEK